MRLCDMPTRPVRFKYLHTYKDVRGKQRAYYTPPGGKRVALPLPVGSTDFLVAYTEAVKGNRQAIRTPIPVEEKDTFRGLIRLYLGSPLFAALNTTTKTNYRRVLDRFSREYGKLPVNKFARRHAQALLAKYSDRPEAANNMMKRLRMLLYFAVDIGMISSNPMSGMKGFKSSSEGYHTWTEDEIERFVVRHPFGTKPYLALSLMLHTGQRRVDAVRMGWKDVTDGLIRVRQQKTGTPLMIPIAPTLQRALAELPKDAATFLLTEYGKPFSVAGFGNWMRDRCNEAGLTNCSSHGLRKACARRLAEAGCTHHEIKAITGHKTDAEVRRYTEKSDQVLLAHRALEKLEETAQKPKSANHL